MAQTQTTLFFSFDPNLGASKEEQIRAAALAQASRLIACETEELRHGCWEAVVEVVGTIETIYIIPAIPYREALRRMHRWAGLYPESIFTLKYTQGWNWGALSIYADNAALWGISPDEQETFVLAARRLLGSRFRAIP